MGATLDYILGLDVGRDIVRDLKKNWNSESDWEPIRNLASYYLAIGQRFVPHALAIYGLAEMVSGNYARGSAFLAPVPLLGAASRHFFSNGKAVENTKKVIDYLVGADIVRYIRAYEKIVDKLDKRMMAEKGIDWYSHPWIFVGRWLPTALLVDGLRRIATGQLRFSSGHNPTDTVINLAVMAEVAYPIYKYMRDYIRYRRMIVWTKFLEAHDEEVLGQVIAKMRSKQSNSGNGT